MQLYSGDANNNRPDSVNDSENKKELTPCGKEKTIKRYISGKTFPLPYCGYEYCYPCKRDEKLSKVPESIVYNTYRGKVSFLITIAIGNYQDISNIPLFEKSVSTATRYNQIIHTFCAGYEKQGSCVNIHYGLFLANNDDLQGYEKIVRKFALKYFPGKANDKQVEITPFDTAWNLVTYVTKLYWSNIASFAIPKAIKKTQVRWRRGYREFFSQYW